MMIWHRLGVFIVALLVSGLATGATQCQKATAVPWGVANRIEADASRQVRILQPNFFGFNLEWLEFQLGLWDRTSRRVVPGLTEIFREFPGAVYRFPGGTNSNHIDWRDAVGPIDGRPARKHVTWAGPLRTEFGIDEYLRFVKEVGGQAWYVANLYGTLEAPVATDRLASNAEALAAYLKQRESEGALSILRWELGNELDRAQYKWPPEKLAKATLTVAAAIARGNPQARFVHLQQEYPAQQATGYSAEKYNKELRAALSALKPEFAMHFYFDGPPETPPAEYFLKQLCQIVDGAKAEGSPGQVWVTELGRVPNGFWAKVPKELWPETGNLRAAISVAEMHIALSGVPEVQGAITHALVSSNNPWPMVHIRADGRLDRSVPLLALGLLRSSMMPHVLPTVQSSSNGGKLGTGNAIRGAVLSDPERKNFTLWVVNKSDVDQTVEFEIKNTRGVDVRYKGSLTISDDQANANNYASKTRVMPASNTLVVIAKGPGKWGVSLGPNSVSSVSFGSTN